ncbi:MAG: DNA-directed RNA polymerase subunit alpha C-terminal domain-containing protein [Planctomycetota bacterium]
METTEKDAVEILKRDILSDAEIGILREALFYDIECRQNLKQCIEKISSDDSVSHATRVKTAFVSWLLGGEAPWKIIEQHFQNSELAAAIYIKILISSNAHEEALKALGKAVRNLGRTLRLSLLEIELIIIKGNLSEAKEKLKAAASAFSPVTASTIPSMDSSRIDRAQFLFLKGYLLELEGLWKEALSLYEEAIKFDKDHLKAHFRLAYFLDLYGDDEGAIFHYEEARRIRPLYLGVQMNLGTLYEDYGKYKKALACYNTILDVLPNHKKASLFLRDTDAAQTMVYDEEEKKEQDKLSHILSTPISDFELSVRSRNCLAKMHINTLGELSQKTEVELLSYKNFGETSLREIKQLLASKGLSLGINKESYLAKKNPESDQEIFEQNKDRQDFLQLPVAALELSVRGRTCLERIGILTISELVSKSPEELLGMRNFGQVSLNEIRQQLTKYGISLKEPQ